MGFVRIGMAGEVLRLAARRPWPHREESWAPALSLPDRAEKEGRAARCLLEVGVGRDHFDPTVLDGCLAGS